MSQKKTQKSTNEENTKKPEDQMINQKLNKHLPSFTEILLENKKNLYKSNDTEKKKEKKENKYYSSLKKKKSITPENPRRFSATIRELDLNSYRAYKMSIDEQKNNILKINNKSTSEILNNQHNIMKVPFGLKSKRFDWQTDIERNYLDELNGNNKNYNKRKNTLNWEEFLNKKEINDKTNNINKNNYAHIYSTILNLNSKRTIQPQRDIIPEIKTKASKKFINRSSSTGSIISLFNRTPNIKNIPINENITKGNNLFSDEFFNGFFFKKSKRSVDLDKFKKNGYAGLTKEKKSDDSFLYKNNNNNNFYHYGFKERIKREKNDLMYKKNSRNINFDLYNNNDNIIHFTNELKHSQLMRIKNNISDIFFIKGGKEKIFQNFKKNQLTYTFDYSQNQF